MGEAPANFFTLMFENYKLFDALPCLMFDLMVIKIKPLRLLKGILNQKGESPATTMYSGGGVIVITYLELLSSNLVYKPNLGLNFDF